MCVCVWERGAAAVFECVVGVVVEMELMQLAQVVVLLSSSFMFWVAHHNYLNAELTTIAPYTPFTCLFYCVPCHHGRAPSHHHWSSA